VKPKNKEFWPAATPRQQSPKPELIEGFCIYVKYVGRLAATRLNGVEPNGRKRRCRAVLILPI